MLDAMLSLTRYGVNSLVVLQTIGTVVTDEMKQETKKHGERAASLMRQWIMNDALGLQPVSAYTATLKEVSAPPLVESVTMVNAISYEVVTDDNQQLDLFVGVKTEGAPMSETTLSVTNYPTAGNIPRIDEIYTKSYAPISVAKVAEMQVKGGVVWANYPKPKSFPITLPKRDFVTPSYEKYKELFGHQMEEHTVRVVNKATAMGGVV